MISRDGLAIVALEVKVREHIAESEELLRSYFTSKWYKNLVKNPTVQISLGRNSATVHAKPVTSKEIVEQVADKFRGKYGDDQVKKIWLTGESMN